MSSTACDDENLQSKTAVIPAVQHRLDCDNKATLDLELSESVCRVLVGVTGSVAAIKLPLLVSQLLEIGGVSVYATTIPLEFDYSQNAVLFL